MGNREKVKERYLKLKEKSIIQDYYSREIYKGKTYRAVNLDKIASVILLLLLFNIIILSLIESIIISMFISLILIILICKAFIATRDHKIDKKIQGINEDLKSKRVIRELSQMNRQEFINYSKELLEKYYLSEFVYGEDGIDLIGEINNKSYGVKCIKSTVNDRIIGKKVEEFHNYINYLDYDEGIIITNSYFEDETREKTSLILFDFKDFKDILKSIDEYPSDEVINNYIKYRHDDNKKTFQAQMKVFSLKKIIRLYFCSMILYLISYFVRFTFYYRIVAVIIFCISTIIGGMKIAEYVKQNSKMPLHK